MMGSVSFPLGLTTAFNAAVPSLRMVKSRVTSEPIFTLPKPTTAAWPSVNCGEVVAGRAYLAGDLDCSTYTGDFIVVVNVEKLRVTGNKAKDKLYNRHSGYPGGLYTTNFEKMQAKHPARVLEKAVKGMLPKGPLGYAMLKKMKAYAGTDHPHTAQQPKTLEI